MADTKISAETAASALGGTEVFPAVQGAGNVKVTSAQIRTYAQSGLAALATSGSGADLTNNSVSLNKIATQAANTFLANNTGSSAAPIAITVAQAKTLLALTAADITLGVSSQATTSYTAVIGDANTYIRFTASTAVTFTIPPNSSVAFAVGTVIEMEQAGSGPLSVAAGAGVTLNSRGADLTVAGQFSVAFVKKVATDTWTLAGDM